MPHIYGQFTNWKPKKMIGVKDFCKVAQVNTVQIMYLLHQQVKVSRTKNSFNELNEEEKEVFLQQLNEGLKPTATQRWS